jgi:hypothetical protein
MLNKFRICLMASFSVVLFFSSASCRESQSDLAAQGYIKAEIKDYRGLDGCTFLIQPEAGGKLEPVGLADEFRMDGLPYGSNTKYLINPWRVFAWQVK